MRNNRNNGPRIGIEWLAEKLGVDSNELDLYICADYKSYFKQSYETRKRNRKNIQYYHPKKGIIYLGSDFIKIGKKIVANVGYESEDPIQKIQNTEKSER